MKIYILFILFTLSSFFQTIKSQVFDEPVPHCTSCNAAGIKTPGTPYGYGWNITHNPGCPELSKTNEQQPNILIQNLPPEMQQLNTLIDLFNTPNTDSKRLVEQEAARKRIAEMKAIEDKKQLDRIARNEKLKEELKPIEFVPFQTSPAPETMEDREIRILKNTKGVKYNTGDFSGGSGSVRIEESEEIAEPSEAEMWLNEHLKKVESYRLGRLGAIIGRGIFGIAKETNSYMTDAFDAVAHNDMSKWQDLADMDNKKLVVNGFVDGTKTTAKAYVEAGVSYVKDGVKNYNIGLLKSGATSYIMKYKKDFPLTYQWVILQ
jgi:hypothetical protein